MGLQSRRSPGWRDFETPGKEKSFGCGPCGEVQRTPEEGEEAAAPSIIRTWRGAEYTIRGRWWLPPSSGCGESCVSVLLVVHPNTKSVPSMH